MKTKEEFALRLKPDGNGCQLWQGAKDGNGYGSVNWNGRVTPAHRIAYFLSKGNLPPHARVQWNCSNKKNCMNGDHLGYVIRGEKKEVQKRQVKIPLVVPDQSTRISSLIQELTREAEHLDKVGRKSMVYCSLARDAMDKVLLEISSIKSRLEKLTELEQLIIHIFQQEDFKEVSELGREIKKEQD